MDSQIFTEESVFRQQQNNLPNATAVLVLGIIGIIGCFCYGIPGLVCNIIALVLAKKDMDLYNQAPDNYTKASYDNLKAGRICAIIGLCLCGIGLLIGIAYFSLIQTALFESLDR